jgi:hypothetical protein
MSIHPVISPRTFVFRRLMRIKPKSSAQSLTDFDFEAPEVSQRCRSIPLPAMTGRQHVDMPMSVMLSPTAGGSRDEERQESFARRYRPSFIPDRSGLIPPPEVCAPTPFLATTLRWWTWFYVKQRRSSDDIALPNLAQGEIDDPEKN